MPNRQYSVNSQEIHLKEQIKELALRGHVIGSHSSSHPERMDIMSVSELNNEWLNSTQVLKEIVGQDILTASIPNGYSNHKVLEVMNKMGIVNIYTSNPTTKIRKFKGSNIIRRYVITNDVTPEYVVSLISSSSLRFKMKLRHDILGFAKFVLGNNYLKIRRKLLQKIFKK